MKTGKLPEHTLKRSVLSTIRYRNDKISSLPGIGYDGAVMGDIVTAMSSTAFCYTGNEQYAICNAMNNLIAEGARPFGVEIAVLLPEHSEEADLRRIMDSLAHYAEKYQIAILGGHTELIPSVQYPTVVITAFGKKIWENQYKKVTAGMDIVMTKWVGLYGGALLADVKREELLTKYPGSYIDTAKQYMEETSLMPEVSVMEAAVAEHPDCIYAAHDVTNGGLFGALWQLLSACDCGGTMQLKDIYMKQEIIEICEYFDLNPYMMNGQGSLLIIGKDGKDLVERFQNAGIAAHVIGNTTKEPDRKVMIGEEERFLVPPKGDALNVVFYGQKMQI